MRTVRREKRARWLWTVVAVGWLLVPVQAFCEGFGFYSWGRGWPSVGVPDFLKEQVPAFQDLKVDLCYDHFSMGYLYDGASATGDRFGWRFNLGVDIALAGTQGSNASVLFGSSLVEEVGSSLFDAVGLGFTTKLAYGIGIFQTRKVRIWAGPSAALTANYLIQGSTSLQQGSLLYEARPWGVSLSLGGGLEAGVRWGVSEEVTLDLSTGFHYNFFGLYQDARLKLSGTSVESDTSFLLGQEPHVFVQMAVRFKMTGD